MLRSAFNHMIRPRGLYLGAILFLALGDTARAQAPDTLRLADLRVAAARQDARALQGGLLARAAALRLSNLRARRLPRLNFSGQGTLQSDVPSILIPLPGVSIPEPPREQFRAQAEADWLLFDGGRLSRQATAERARFAEGEAGVEVTLYEMREATTETFFGALLLQAQAQTLALAAADLEARLALTRSRVKDGAALPADTAALKAEAIRLRQQTAEAEASRHAALAVLADLTGYPITADDVLALPDLAAADLAAADLEVADSLGRRPELVRLQRTAERLGAEARVAEAETRPHLSLFGQAGVGRPSPFDFLSDETKPFALAGVRLRWSPLDWGQARRTADVLRLQARIVETDAAALADRLRRAAEDDAARIGWLEKALEEDARVEALREEVLLVARRQFEEGVLLAPDYAGRVTDLAAARLTRERHRIELAQARARLLSTLGRFPEPRLLDAPRPFNPSDR